MNNRMILWLKNEWRENQIKWAVVISTIVLIAICIPLLMISHYNYPSGDDFCFGGDVYRAIKADAGIAEIMRVGLQEWKEYYFGWQGTYVATFLHIFQLGGKVSGGYFLTTYFLLGILVISSITFYKRLFRQIIGCEKHVAYFVTCFLVCAQLVFVPGLVESIYWFVGGAAYTFFYSILLLFLATIFKIKEANANINGLYIWSVLLLIILGGGNYVTGLLTAELIILGLIFFYKEKNICWKDFLLAIIYFAAFAANVLAPGTMVRQGNHVNLPILDSILESIKVGMYFMKLWTHGYVWIILLILVPFIISGVLKTKYVYKYPLLFSIVSFGIWCSNVTPSIYVNGTWGGDRIVAVVYYQYFIMWTINISYWLGWIIQQLKKLHKDNVFERIVHKNYKMYVIPYLGLTGTLLCISVVCPGYIRGINPVLAVQSIRSGEAEQYRIEQQERWSYIENTEEMDLEVSAFSVGPILLFHDDIQTDAGDWRNTGMADFFGKNSIKIEE